MSTNVNKNTREKTISCISILFSHFQNSTHIRGLPGKAFAFRVHRFNSPANSQQVLSMPLSDHGSWTKRPLKHNHGFSHQKRRVMDFFDWFFNKYIHKNTDARNPAPVRFAIDPIILQGFIQLKWLFGSSSEINRLSEIRIPYYSWKPFWKCFVKWHVVLSIFKPGFVDKTEGYMKSVELLRSNFGSSNFFVGKWVVSRSRGGFLYKLEGSFTVSTESCLLEGQERLVLVQEPVFFICLSIWYGKMADPLLICSPSTM